MQRILTLEDLEDEIRHDVAEGELDVATHDVGIADCTPFTDPDAVERADDRVWELVLLPSTLRKVLRRQLLEAVGRDRRRRSKLRSLRGREDGRRLVNHGAADH